MQLHQVLWPNKYMMVLLGLWPIRSTTGFARRIFIYFRVILALFAMISLLVPHFMTVVVNWGDIKILGDYGALTVVYFLVVLKMLYYALRHRSYNSMYQHIKDFWQISDDPDERANYEQLAIIAKYVTIISFVSGIGDFLMFEAVAVVLWMKNHHHEINESLYHRPLPMELFYGFDTQSTPTYEIIWFWQSVCMLYSLCSVIGGDCTMMALILHLAGQFKLISCRFREIGRKIDERTVSNDNEVDVDIGKCVAYHQHTIKVANELNSLLSPLVFGQIMTSGIEICLAGYAVMEGDNNDVELIKFVVFFVSLLVQLIVWCWPSELLMQESGAIADTIYHDIPWFQLTSKQQRDLNIVVVRAQKPCHVSAFYQVMSIRKLTEVFNAAGSYMALLKSMKQ